MKTKLTAVLILCSLSVYIATCKKKDNPARVSRDVKNDLAKGSWRISLFSDNGKDETANYAAYLFSFNKDGSVEASGGNNTWNGTWSSGKDDDHAKLLLSFPPPLEDLSDDWHIVRETTDMIELEDVSGGKGGIDMLHFQKI